jgi:hypothetical protein
MRTPNLAASLCSLAAVLCLSPAVRADDTKPPAITDVKPSIKGGSVTIEARITDETGVLSATVHHRSKGGKVEDTNMVKNDYDDVFKATFAGAGDTEYWIDSSDILGNGPSTYGSSSKPMAANGKAARGSTAVAAKEPAHKEEPAPKAEPAEPAEPKHHREESASAEHPSHRSHHGKPAAVPPSVEHRKPSAQPPEGQEFTIRVKIHDDVPVPVAVLQSKAAGSSSFTNTLLTHTDGDNYEAKIAAAAATGTVEYFIVAKNETGQMTRQGDGDSTTPYTVTFKGGGAAATGSSSSDKGWTFSHWSVSRVDPNKPLLVRAQIAPAADDGQVPDKAMVLFRGNDGQDQQANMQVDPNGGFGGFKAELPAQADGAIYYQIVACDEAGKKCAIDTGSKKKWHGAVVGTKGAEPPLPLNTASSKAPDSLAD